MGLGCHQGVKELDLELVVGGRASCRGLSDLGNGGKKVSCLGAVVVWFRGVSSLFLQVMFFPLQLLLPSISGPFRLFKTEF